MANRRPTDRAPKKSPNLITRSDAARLRGVTPSAVSHACADGGPLRAAVRGQKLDRNDPAFVAWASQAGLASVIDLRELTRQKRAAEVEKLEISNAEVRGSLIRRELVRHHVFGAIENANRRLLSDAPRTISSRVYALAKSGASREEAERTVREIINSHLRMVKTTAVRVLRAGTDSEPA